MERERAAEDKRNARDAKLKERINEYQMLKMKTDKIDAERKREDEIKKAQREELRQ
jgi:3-isopropylmalate dehydratase small subunit